MAAFHLLGKLADVKQAVPAVAYLHMAVINIAAGPVDGRTALPENTDLPAVRDAEQLLVVRVDEPDALFSLFHVPVQPVAAVAVEKQIFLPLVGVQPDQIGILCCVRSEAERKAAIVAALLVSPAEIPHGVTAFQKPVVLLVPHQGLQDLLKLLLKVLGVQIFPVAGPLGKEALAILTHIRSKVPDTPSLALNLCALSGNIKPLRWSSGAKS